MKQLFENATIIITFATILLTSCSSPTTLTPPIINNSGSVNEDGTNLNYPDASGVNFSEENLPLEGSLDDDSSSGFSNSPYGFPEGFDPDAQSDSYKKTHGRSTPGMNPLYFRFDQARISPDMLPVAEKNAAFLLENPSAYIVLEGNSDQRGTNEYNMALSERRAINVRDFLIDMGINPDRITTVSYGEERPLFPEHSEDAYKYNRRVDFVAK